MQRTLGQGHINTIVGNMSQDTVNQDEVLINSSTSTILGLPKIKSKRCPINFFLMLQIAKLEVHLPLVNVNKTSFEVILTCGPQGCNRKC